MSYSTIQVTQEGPANALALNKDYSQVVIAGRNVFKVFTIQEDQFNEVCNLRVGKNLNLNFSCNDVAWNAIDDHYLATAATNGAVVLWNLNKSGRSKQEHVFIDHKRTVNKVSFHTTEASWLISGSQDGTMKCFDLRTKEAVKTFLSNTESVRDVQFSPHAPQVFAAVSENGNVQLWDIRRPDRCQQQFTAHSGPIFACDWHPESTWLATASRDKTIKVWDLTVKPQLEYTIHTIASIGRVKWRPQKKYHIASCALVVDCSINVWDVRRPFIPYAAFNEHKDVATGVAWRGDPDVFLSTSRDCTLYQHAFRDASRPASNANPQGISLNTKGDILYACKTVVNTSLSAAKLHSLMPTRKTSIAGVDQFHIASSSVHRFTSNLSKDHNFFYLCAQRYMMHGKPLAEMCDHNAMVAEELGKPEISIIWNIIKSLYANDCSKTNTNSTPRDEALVNGSTNLGLDLLESDERSRGEDTPRGDRSAADEALDDDRDNPSYYSDLPNHFGNFRSNFQLPKGDFCFGENELDIEFDRISNDLRNGLFRSLTSISDRGDQQQDWTLPSEAFPLRHEIQNRSPPPEQFPNHESPDIVDESQTVVEDQPAARLTVCVAGTSMGGVCVWDGGASVVQALQQLALCGDVQTPACVLLTLGHKRHTLTMHQHTQEHWLLGYIDLLARHRLWNVATQVIKLAWIPHVHHLNQQSTTIHTNCGRCSKPLQRSGWLCDRCHSPENALCSVCHQVVKGLYAWCQGCSHGGHLLHMQEWIGNNRLCPTGCGHTCEYS